MSVQLVNDHVLIPDGPDWASHPEAGEEWRTDVAAAVRGGEDRSANLQKPFRFLSYQAEIWSAAEREPFYERLRAALQSGRAAVPFWPRCDLVEVATGLTLTLAASSWPWTAGDVVYLCDDAGGEAATLDVVAGRFLTLHATLSRAYAANSAVHPLLYGRLECDQSSLTHDTESLKLKVAEPSGLGSFADYTCAAAPTVPATAAFNVCEGVPNAGVHALANTCPTLYEIRWPAIFGANLYKLFEKRDTDGDWTENLVETIQRDATTGEYYVRLRPVDFTRSERFYAVTARVGDKDSDYSATITLPTITIERLMRSAQERWHNAAIAWGTPPHGGYDITTDDPPFILWPDRTIGTPSAFEYPADDFYRADLEADATVIVDLLKYLARVFADSEWVQRYIYYDPSVIPGHTAPPPCEQLQANTDLPVVDLGPSIEDSIDGDNVIAKARAIGGFICLCDLLDVPCEWTDLATKVVTIYFSHACSGGDGCGESKQAALDRQDLPPWDHGYLYSNYDFGDLSCYVSTTLVDDNPILGQPPAPQVYFLSTEDDGIDGYTSVSFRARGRLNAPLLDQYFKGIPLPFLKAGPADHFGGAGADTPAFTAFGQALPMASSQLGSPPVDKFGWWSESGLQVEGGAVVKSNVLTNSEPALAASLVCLADPGLGWQITDQRVLLWRSRFWNNAEWDYFV